MIKENDMCPICGKGKLTRVVGTETFNYKEWTIDIPNYVVWKCGSCGEAIVDKQTLKDSGKVLKEFRDRVNQKQNTD
jgi:YgiT-type zinc finger domain-containing protein